MLRPWPYYLPNLFDDEEDGHTLMWSRSRENGHNALAKRPGGAFVSSPGSARNS